MGNNEVREASRGPFNLALAPILIKVKKELGLGARGVQEPKVPKRSTWQLIALDDFKALFPSKVGQSPKRKDMKSG